MFDETLLHWETLTKLINDFRPEGVPLIASGLFSKQQTQGQQYQLDIIKINRTKAGVVGKNSVSTAIAPEVIKRQAITLARSFENVRLPGSSLLNLRNPGTLQLQKIASDQVAREVKKMARRLDYRNEFYMAQAIQGTLTDTVDGISFTIDFLFPASHKLTVGGGQIAGCLVTAWSDPDADVIGDITLIKQQVMQDSGYELKKVIASPEVIANLIKNNQVNTYFRSTPDGTAMLKEGNMGTFMGLEWVSYGSTYKNSSDVVTRFLPANGVAFLPAPDPLVAELVEGEDTIPTPNKMDIQSVIGRYSYASISEDPASIKLYAGEVSLPVIYVPAAFLYALTA